MSSCLTSLRAFLLTGTLLVAALVLQSCQRRTDPGPQCVIRQASRGTLTAFGSESELSDFLKELSEAQKRDLRRRSPGYGAPQAVASASPASATEAGSSTPAEESVTNTQHAGVDEGGIVKTYGDYLVVLRRGRLFTIKVADGALTPVASIDAYGPGIDPAGAWYDEMLIGGNTIVVVGYSYERGGTELGLFDIDRAGRLAYRSTYHLRSNDYYSSRNYASRLLGTKLVFYAPLYLSYAENDPFASFPALRKWHSGATSNEFHRIAAATSVYRPILPSAVVGLHTVTICDLAQPELTCQATVVLGPPGRVFYVSPGAVYIWVTDTEYSNGRSVAQSLLYRMPLEGSAPSALRTSGAPLDQFSFLEGDDGFLNVLVRSDSRGEGMWAAEVNEGDVALMRISLESFSSGAERVPTQDYRPLPKPSGYDQQNRFVGGYVLYGSGTGWGSPERAMRGTLYAYPYARGGQPVTLPLVHGVDRIEALGSHAIVIGTDGKDLHFSPVALGTRPSLAERYTRKNASQGELRSHGFFYKPTYELRGMLGLPIRGGGLPGSAHLVEDSASVLFLNVDRLRLGELGALSSSASNLDDQCKASCVDWYGNARPLFLRSRVFALLGYELVEGTLAEGRLRETRRISFAPTPSVIAR